MSHAKRQVYVSDCGSDSWLVKYVHRNRGQRHCAATFHKSMKTFEEVLAWVRNSPRFTLSLHHHQNP